MPDNIVVGKNIGFYTGATSAVDDLPWVDDVKSISSVVDGAYATNTEGSAYTPLSTLTTGMPVIIDSETAQEIADFTNTPSTNGLVYGAKLNNGNLAKFNITPLTLVSWDGDSLTEYGTAYAQPPLMPATAALFGTIIDPNSGSYTALNNALSGRGVVQSFRKAILNEKPGGRDVLFAWVSFNDIRSQSIQAQQYIDQAKQLTLDYKDARYAMWFASEVFYPYNGNSTTFGTYSRSMPAALTNSGDIVLYQSTCQWWRANGRTGASSLVQTSSLTSETFEYTLLGNSLSIVIGTYDGTTYSGSNLKVELDGVVMQSSYNPNNRAFPGNKPVDIAGDYYGIGVKAFNFLNIGEGSHTIKITALETGKMVIIHEVKRVKDPNEIQGGIIEPEYLNSAQNTAGKGYRYPADGNYLNTNKAVVNGASVSKNQYLYNTWTKEGYPVAFLQLNDLFDAETDLYPVDFIHVTNTMVGDMKDALKTRIQNFTPVLPTV